MNSLPTVAVDSNNLHPSASISGCINVDTAATPDAINIREEMDIEEETNFTITFPTEYEKNILIKKIFGTGPFYQ